MDYTVNELLFDRLMEMAQTPDALSASELRSLIAAKMREWLLLFNNSEFDAPGGFKREFAIEDEITQLLTTRRTAAEM